jgi:nucleotide-binding universal stress UspA family protein
MKTLLVPIDFSEMTRSVVTAAGSFAEKFGSKVILIHVIMPPPPITNDYTLSVGTMQEVLGINERAAQTKLNRYAKKLSADGIKLETRVLQGPPGYSIIEEAKRVKATAIVIGSHGHGKLYDLFVGSTANTILKDATCTVIVLPSRKR